MPTLLTLVVGVLLIIVGFLVPTLPWGVLCWIAGGLCILLSVGVVGPRTPTGRRWW